MCRCRDAHCIGASLNEGVNVVAPIILGDSDLKLFSMHTMDLLNNFVCHGVLTCCWLAFDALADKHLLKSDAPKLVAIVVSTLFWLRIAT